MRKSHKAKAVKSKQEFQEFWTHDELVAIGQGKATRLAHDIYDYIAAREKFKGCEFESSPEFVEGFLRIGVREYAGIEVHEGQQFKDHDEPYRGFLKRWLKGRSTH